MGKSLLPEQSEDGFKKRVWDLVQWSTTSGYKTWSDVDAKAKLRYSYYRLYADFGVMMDAHAKDLMEDLLADVEEERLRNLIRVEEGRLPSGALRAVPDSPPIALILDGPVPAPTQQQELKPNFHQTEDSS